MTHTLLSTDQIAAALESLPGWTADGAQLKRSYRFPDFVSAFDWMTVVAAEAERIGHHPNWSNVYSGVEVALSTHDAGGLTELDVALASFMEAAASEAK